MNVKAYLVDRATSTTAWVGFLGFFLEILLHLGGVSVIMLCLYVALVIAPEAYFKELFAGWAKKLDEL